MRLLLITPLHRGWRPFHGIIHGVLCHVCNAEMNRLKSGVARSSGFLNSADFPSITSRRVASYILALGMCANRKYYRQRDE